jgi:hypothetical protein
MQKTIIITLLILLSFIFTALFFKAISKEDCWMPDGEGGWVKHGVPAGPPPDYPSQIKETSIGWYIILLFLSGSLVSSFNIYIYLRLVELDKKKFNC